VCIQIRKVQNSLRCARITILAIFSHISHSFVTELREESEGAAGDASTENLTSMSGLVHTHKLARGHHAIASLANYGIHLAQMLMMPTSVIERSKQMVTELNQAEKLIPEVSDDDISKLNCLRLV
jgi:DNA mismatch repair ATPase MutS